VVRKFRLFNVLDEFTNERLKIRIDRELNVTDSISVLTSSFSDYSRIENRR